MHSPSWPKRKSGLAGSEQDMITLHPDMDVRPTDLIEFNGDHGPFYICGAGGWPERGDCFFYGDQKYQFFFYADVITFGEAEYEIRIKRATSRRLAGPPARINRADFGYIEDNIRAVLKERNYFLLERSLGPGEEPRLVEFTWGAFS
jgi:hypothetical protein